MPLIEIIQRDGEFIESGLPEFETFFPGKKRSVGDEGNIEKTKISAQ